MLLALLILRRFRMHMSGEMTVDTHRDTPRTPRARDLGNGVHFLFASHQHMPATYVYMHTNIHTYGIYVIYVLRFVY